MANTTSVGSEETKAILEGIRKLTANPPEDEKLRDELYKAIKKLSPVIEHPHDTIYRVIHSPKVLTVARVAVGLKIFDLLSKRDLETSELAKKAGCDKVLAGRILRYLASHDMITEIGEDRFAANAVTKTLAIEGYQAGIRHGYESINPILLKMNEFLVSTNYVNPSNMLKTPFQLAYNTELPAFAYAQKRPDLIIDFDKWMAVLHALHKSWLDVYDFPKHCEGSTDGTVIFVDVAGGLGHQCTLLRTKHEKLKGRVILQEQKPQIDKALETLNSDVETQVIDIWEGQPVKGAKAYYFRAVMHDYSDSDCIKLLNFTMKAMSHDSILVIDEMIVPNVGAHSMVTELDIEMMCCLASMERTEKQWDALLESAGLKVVQKSRYIEGSGESVIVAKLK